MALFTENESLLNVELGRILRIPCKFIQGEVDAHPALVKNIAKQMQKTGKNLLPVIVKILAEDQYEAIDNTQIFKAAQQANLDFVWCIVIDEQMLTQIRVESGEIIQIPILTASEQDIAESLEYLKTKKSGMRTINAQKAAKSIIEHRANNKINSLNFLTKKRCGIGTETIKKLKSSLVIE